jgi:hypothetical protein
VNANNFWLRRALLATLAVSGAIVAARVTFGPFHLPVLGWVRSPLVAEGVCALAATLILLMHGAPRAPVACQPPGFTASRRRVMSASGQRRKSGGGPAGSRRGRNEVGRRFERKRAN